MAEQNGTAPSPTTWRKRLVPKPSGVLELEDESGKTVEYSVWSVLDIPSAHAVQVLAAEEEIAGGGKDLTYARIMELGKLQVNLVCPDLPSTVLESLSPNQVMEIRRKALGYDAANPPIPEKEMAHSAPSSGSSPQSSGSSAGPRKRRARSASTS